MPLPRPGFNSALVTLALGATLALGVCGAGSAHATSAVEAHAREEILSYGFRPVDDLPTVAREGDATTPSLFAASRTFRLALPNGEIEGEAISRAEESRSAALVRAELARYPAAFVAAIHLHGVLLTRELREGGRPIPSLPNCGGAMLLDVDASPEFLRRLVHHEVFHFADLADDGTLKQDPAWESLNDHFFVYGDGGRASRDPSASRLTDAYPGFLDVYARSAVEEDKAETFAFLMTEPARVARIASRDAVVQSKVRAIRERVTRLSPEGAALFPL